MNILFFLKPKSEVSYLYDDYSLRQSLEKMERHGYTAIPIIGRGYSLETCPPDFTAINTLILILRIGEINHHFRYGAGYGFNTKDLIWRFTGIGIIYLYR